jgi:cell division protein FtsB
MNSIQVSKPVSKPRSRSQATSPRRQGSFVRAKPRHSPNRAIALETSAKLTVNLVISIVAVSALLQLIPSYKEQKQKLQEISHEVEQTEDRVQRLRSEFTRNFDPQQAPKIMQEQTELQDPQQLQIIWKQDSQPVREIPQPQIRRKPVNSLPTDRATTAFVD